MARLSGEKTMWFDVPDDPDGGRIEIKHLKKGETRDIEDQIELFQTMLKPDAEGNLQQETKVTKAKGDKRYAYLCAAIVNWEYFFGLDGEPLECTDANKILVARDDDEGSFGRFVAECRTKLGEIVARERRAERKNLKS